MKLSFEQLAEAVRLALWAVLGDAYPPTPAYGWRIVATFADSVIVATGPSTLSSYPVTVEASGAVTLGAPAPVEAVYQALTEAAGGRLVGALQEAEGKGKPGARWLVCAIQEGLSKNRTFYPADVLQAAAPLYEGAKVFWNHSGGEVLRDPRDIAGFLKGAKFALLGGGPTREGASVTPASAILATLHATDAGLRERLLEAHEAGNPDLFGLSHTAQADTERVRMADGWVVKVKAIKAVESVDVVSFPSAGGRVVRLAAGLSSPVTLTDQELEMLEQLIEALKKARPDLAKRLSATPTEAEVRALLTEAITPPAPAQGGTTATPPAAAPAADSPRPDAAGGVLTEADRSLLREARVTRLMEGRTLPEALRPVVRDGLLSLAKAGASEEELRQLLEANVNAAAKLAEGGPKGSGQGSTMDVTKDEADKVREGIDGFFMAGASDGVLAQYKAITGHDAPKDGFRSVRSLYEGVTGDKHVSGYLKEAAGLRRFQRLLEGIGTATFTNLLGDSVTRRMLSEYRATDYSTRWRRACSRIVPLPDFRTQERLRWGSFADLPAVGQGAPYTELANPTDEKIQYAATKRGALVWITREAIKNDDVGLVRELPQRIAFAAARTLHKFVFDLIVTNPTLDDSVALFAAATTRGASSAGNLITTGLSQSNVSVARQRLLKVTDRDSNTVLGLSPKLLIVPPELEEVGFRLTSIPMAPIATQNATEPNIVRARYGMDELIVLETLTDADDYFILADPRLVNTLEIGFVDGQEEPALFVQDQENSGSVFSSDKLTWKVRHEYGGDVMDWRGMIGGIVP